MNFYFCEACGKRVTEIDIGAGKAKDKKLKGVYCTECSAGVMTMDNLPLTQEQARQILANEPAKTAGARTRPATKDVTASVVRPGTKDHSASATARPIGAPPRKDAGVKPAVYVAIGVVVLALVAGVAAFSGGGKPPVKPVAGNAKPDPAATTAVDVPAKPIEPAAKPVPEVRPAIPVAPNSAETAAAMAFAQLGKSFDALPAADLAGRVALGEAFLREHGEALEAARVRVSVDTWKKEIAAKSAPPPEIKPAEIKPVEAAATEPKPEPAEVKADLPPIFTQDHRDQLKLFEELVPLLAKSQIGAALIRAQRERRYNLQESLVRVLKRSCEVQERAIEAINKKPPSEPVKATGKVAITGKIARIKDGKAWINAQGMETPVDLSEIPRAVLLKALELDVSKPSGLADKFAFEIGVSDVEAMFEFWRTQDKVAFHDFVVIAETYAKLKRQRQFELALEEIEKTLGSDSVAKIEAFKETFRGYARLNQARVDRLMERAKGMVPSALLKKAFSGEVLKAEDSGYVEVRYTIAQGRDAWKDFELGQGWLFDQNSLRFGCQKDGNLTYLPKFKPGKLRVEFLVACHARQEMFQAHVGFVHLSARWHTPMLHLVYEAVYSKHHQFGENWALPEIKDKTCRYVIDRTPEKTVFSIDDKTFKELELNPETVKSEPPAKIFIWSWERLMLKEVVIKGFVDTEWLQTTVKP